MTVTVQHRQTLSDIAMQVYGDIRGVTAIAFANNIGITDVLEPGIQLICPDEVYDIYLQNYVRKRRIQPATELEEEAKTVARIFAKEFSKEFA